MRSTLHKQLIQEAYEKSHRTYGDRRITLWIRKHKGVWLNHKTVLRLMHVLQIRSVARRRKLFKKMADLDIYHRYDNVLNRNFSATRPNQKWTTDITYLRSQQGWVYLSVIRDLFDGFIVAYELGRENSLALVLNTLKQAKQNEQVCDGLILHSDQGFPSTSHGYHIVTHEYAITPSMSRRANCWDNAPMENFFGHLKAEALHHVHNPSWQDLKQILHDYVHFYN